MDTSKPRRATRSDIQAMAGIVTDWEKATPWKSSPFTPQEIAGFIDSAFDEREIWVWGDPVVAYLAFNPATSHIGGLYARATGQGVGKALVDQVKQGRDFIWLNTHVPNLNAQRFYKREGFAAVSRHAGDPSDAVEEIRMEWHRR